MSKQDVVEAGEVLSTGPSPSHFEDAEKLTRGVCERTGQHYDAETVDVVAHDLWAEENHQRSLVAAEVADELELIRSR